MKNKAKNRATFGDALHFRKNHKIKISRKHRIEPDKIYPGRLDNLSYPVEVKIFEPETPYPEEPRLLKRAYRVKIKVQRLQHKGSKNSRKFPEKAGQIADFIETPEQQELLILFRQPQKKLGYKVWVRRRQKAKKKLVKSGVPIHLLKFTEILSK